MEIHNHTPFSVMAVPTVCQHDKNHLVVVTKGSFDLSASASSLAVSEQQAPITTADEYWGDPAKSSLRLASDFVLRKSGTDVALIGNVASDRQVARLNIGIRVGNLSTVLHVTGRRFWNASSGDFQISSPEPFTSMPLVYENAFGGSYIDATGHSHGDDRNPVGKGLFNPETYDPGNPPELPNIEFPNDAVTKWHDRPTPAGCGFIASHWQPRRQFTGTYDSEWRAQRLPLLPHDFDDRANNSATAGLFSPVPLRGGEPVRLKNLNSHGVENFLLPKWTVGVACQSENTITEQASVLDTVVVDLLSGKVILTWRTSFIIHWNLARLQWLKLTARQA